MKNKILLSALLTVTVLLSCTFLGLAQPPVVRAVLFYSPTCAHCQKVIADALIPLVKQYGAALQIFAIDTTTPEGGALFGLTFEHYKVPPEQQVVPFLIIGDRILIGSIEIPRELPGLIETSLGQGGNEWPAVPELRAALNLAQATAEAEAQATAQATKVQSTLVETPADTPSVSQPTPTRASAGVSPVEQTPIAGVSSSLEQASSLKSRFTQDLSGNSLAVIVLGGMLISLGLALFFFHSLKGKSIKQPWGYLIPVTCCLGLGVAAYLAYVETSQVDAVCGPIGDCNTVQQSEYAQLFGILPIGVLGVAGYIMILIAWLIGRYAALPLSAYAVLVLLGFTIVGLLFSIYLTFLEPFVIGASCAWCLTSAVLMTVLFWAALFAAKAALLELRQLRRA